MQRATECLSGLLRARPRPLGDRRGSAGAAKGVAGQLQGGLRAGWRDGCLPLIALGERIFKQKKGSIEIERVPLKSRESHSEPFG